MMILCLGTSFIAATTTATAMCGCFTSSRGIVMSYSFEIIKKGDNMLMLY
jgi:NaMN:DMB phosphoribosyltransferase